MRKNIKIITKRLSSFYIDIPALRPGTVGAYALAVVSVGVATALRVALDPYLDGAQFITYYPAIVITTLISGFGAGFVCALLSTAAADFFVLSPRFSFFPETSADLTDLLLFGPLASYLVILIARMRFAIEREQVEANKDRLQSALDAAKLGSWQYDPLQRVFSWDARGKEIFTVAQNAATLEEFMNWVYPDDAERVWAAFRAALDPAQPERSPTQFRLRRGDGKFRWMETQGLARLEGAGRWRRVVTFIGTVQDSAFSWRKSIIAPRTCSVSCTRSPSRLLPKLPRISSSASPGASRRFRPLRTFSSGTYGMASRSRT
jgi:PAS domain-containing protein